MSSAQSSLIADDDPSSGGDSYAGPGESAASSDTHNAGTGRDTHNAGQGRDSDAEAGRPKRRYTRKTQEADRLQGDRPMRQEISEHPRFAFANGIPPLDGNVQMFVRTVIGGQPDTQNIRQFLRRGWEPRLRETVPEGHFPDIVRLTMDKDYGDVVGDHDRILMERPKWIDDREKAQMAQHNERLTQRITQNQVDIERALGRGAKVGSILQDDQGHEARRGETGAFNFQGDEDFRD